MKVTRKFPQGKPRQGMQIQEKIKQPTAVVDYLI